ncbi:MAG TPA: BlaI/MecI/CopY family transcriptional regulator [Acidimicrobiales bacterium]|nr:BlaI/MecI/CopY family transcriptional regulator [Acidimicrobiales bacterium]
MARLGELERKVMDVLWAAVGTELTVRQVAEELPRHAYTTVLTVLDRLERKDMVRRTKEGRAFRYAAAASREAYTAQLMHEALGAALDRDAVLVRFAETVTGAEAQVLRRALVGMEEQPRARAKRARTVKG